MRHGTCVSTVRDERPAAMKSRQPPEQPASIDIINSNLIVNTCTTLVTYKFIECHYTIPINIPCIESGLDWFTLRHSLSHTNLRCYNHSLIQRTAFDISYSYQTTKCFLNGRINNSCHQNHWRIIRSSFWYQTDEQGWSLFWACSGRRRFVMYADLSHLPQCVLSMFSVNPFAYLEHHSFLSKASVIIDAKLLICNATNVLIIVCYWFSVRVSGTYRIIGSQLGIGSPDPSVTLATWKSYNIRKNSREIRSLKEKNRDFLSKNLHFIQ